MKINPTHFFQMLMLVGMGFAGTIQAVDKGIADHTKVDTSLPVFNRTLKAIVTEENSEMGSCILLDDGSAWVVKGFAHGSMKDLKTWAKGDRIVFNWYSKNKDGYYIAYNLEKYGHPKVLIDPQTVNNFPYVTEVFEGGNFVKLSDNSVWNVTWWGRGSTKKWKKGHHIFVQGDGYSNNYVLINLDISGETFHDYKTACVQFSEYQQ